jgi:hypothetical protein
MAIRARAFDAPAVAEIDAMPKKSLLEIAKSAVPEHVRSTGRVVARPSEGVAVLAAAAGHGTAAAAESPHDVADRVAAKLGVKKKRTTATDSADVEFTEHTPLGKRSIVVQVRRGKVKQVLKRA